MLPVLSCLQRQTFPDSSQGHRLWSKNVIFFNEDDAKSRRLFQNYIDREKMNSWENPGSDPTIFFHKFLCLCLYLPISLSVAVANNCQNNRPLLYVSQKVQTRCKTCVKTESVKVEWRTVEWVLDFLLCISFSMIISLTPKQHTLILFQLSQLFFSPGNHSCWQCRTWSQAWDSPLNSSWIRRSSSYWLQPARNPPRNSCEDYSGQKDPGRDTAFLCSSLLSDESTQFCFWIKIP